jgi:hypothetical protein
MKCFVWIRPWKPYAGRMINVCIIEKDSTNVRWMIYHLSNEEPMTWEWNDIWAFLLGM